MSYEARIAHLNETHSMLNRQVDEIESLHPDEPSLLELKKKKLWIKDEVIRLTRLDDAGKEFK